MSIQKVQQAESIIIHFLTRHNPALQHALETRRRRPSQLVEALLEEGRIKAGTLPVQDGPDLERARVDNDVALNKVIVAKDILARPLSGDQRVVAVLMTLRDGQGDPLPPDGLPHGTTGRHNDTGGTPEELGRQRLEPGDMAVELLSDDGAGLLGQLVHADARDELGDEVVGAVVLKVAHQVGDGDVGQVAPHEAETVGLVAERVQAETGDVQGPVVREAELVRAQAPLHDRVAPPVVLALQGEREDSLLLSSGTRAERGVAVSGEAQTKGQGRLSYGSHLDVIDETDRPTQIKQELIVNTKTTKKEKKRGKGWGLGEGTGWGKWGMNETQVETGRSFKIQVQSSQGRSTERRENRNG